jgi:glutamyl-tRNA synthetase
MKIRTRYAPSPTGYLHIGGARTALFCFLFAKKNNGDFVIRIEDTDVKRNVIDGELSQINNLEWLGIIADENPLRPNLKYGAYRQSEKFDIYIALAEKLISEKKAYYCFCTTEELSQSDSNKYSGKCYFLSPDEVKKNIEEKKEKVIRIRMAENRDFSWEDLIRGKITINSESMSDIVIIKSNNIATYNFAVVVDDCDMEITHVLRGEEHISNTPYQIFIKELLQRNNNIQYGHLPIIVNSDGKKLSKRDESVKQFIEDYKNLGYPASGITNYLSLLGWTSENNEELFEMNDLIKNFDISRVSKSPSQFDTNKLEWVCQEKIKKLDVSTFLNESEKFINFEHDKKEDIMLIMKDQISNFNQINDLAKIFTELIGSYSNDIANSLIINTEISSFCNHMISILSIIEDWNKENIKNAITAIKSATNRKGKDLFMPIRYFTSFSTHGPDLVSVLYILGKDLVLKRIREVLNEVN